MNLNNNNFPYPVLGMADDILPLPEVPSYDIKPNNVKEHVINIGLKTNNETIDEYIADGFAQYACEIECRKTFYKSCVTSVEQNFEIRIPRKYVSGEIILTPAVAAIRQIYDYKNPGFHKDYEDTTFIVEPGDLLCAFEQCKLMADIEFDKLKAVSTFITILKTTKSTSYVELDKPKIHLYLPETLHQQYQMNISHQTGYNSIIHSSLALNAILYAILQIENYKDTKWAQTILYRIDTESELQDMDITDPMDAMSIAQILLGDPYQRMFNDIKAEEE